MARENKTATEILAAGKARADQARLNLLAASEATRASAEVAAAQACHPVVCVPASEGDRAVMPAPLAWGALFAALPRGERPMLRRACLATAGKLSLHFTGVRLGQDDLDVLLVLLHVSQAKPLGTTVYVQGGDLLALLGLEDSGGVARGAGGAGARDRLEESLRRLTGALVELKEEGGAVLMGHLVDRAERGRAGKDWEVRLSPDLAPAVAGRIGGIDIRVRRALRGKPLAAWLHAWISSHGGAPHPTSVSKLWELSGSQAEQKEFARKLVRALGSLKKALPASTWQIMAGVLTCRAK